MAYRPAQPQVPPHVQLRRTRTCAPVCAPDHSNTGEHRAIGATGRPQWLRQSARGCWKARGPGNLAGESSERAPVDGHHAVAAVAEAERAQVREARGQAAALQPLRLQPAHQPPRRGRPPAAHQPRHLRDRAFYEIFTQAQQPARRGRPPAATSRATCATQGII